MTLAWVTEPGNLLNAASGLLLIGLGAFILSVRPRRSVNVALAVYSAGFGYAFIARNLLDPQPTWTRDVEGVAALAAAAALAYLAWAFPRPLPRGARRDLALPALAFLASVSAAWTRDYDLRGDAITILTATMWAFATLALFRFARTRPEDGLERRRIALISAAVLAFPVVSGTYFTFSADTGQASGPYIAVSFALTALVGAGWIVAGARGGDPRLGRHLSWCTLGLACAALASGAWFPNSQTNGANGVARTAGVVLLAVGILRGQLLDVDVKMRWTISKSTVAAAFVAIFFVASEGAQALFGRENQAVGLVAAGALVFAMAPLQKAADRLAERAVPVAAAQASAGTLASGNDAAYRDALRVALRDRVLRSDEELALARLADALHLPASRALELRHEIEREMGVRA